MPRYTTYEVWKLNDDDEMLTLVREYEMQAWAENRADVEAADEWSSSVKYVVKEATNETPCQGQENIRASDIGLDGIKLQNPMYVAEP